MSIRMIHDALVLTCGHVVPSEEWSRGSQVKAWCDQCQVQKAVMDRMEIDE